MELTTRGRYAVMAMADLARHEPENAVALSRIAERQRLPLPYLEQLFQQLRKSGLVVSARGRSGGYRLNRGTAGISVADIMAAVEEDTRFTRCKDEGGGCFADQPCITHDLWRALGEATASFLASVTLADVAEGRLTPLKYGGPKRATPRTYLDHNATAPLRPEARRAMLDVMETAGNPSSVHSEGRRARAIIEAAREQVARLCGAMPSEVVFTSGATEANAWALGQSWDTIFLSAIEHDSVKGPAFASPGVRIVTIPTGRDGVIDAAAFASELQNNGPFGRAVVAIQMANNETGIVQPAASVAALARDAGIAVHIDAVQAAGRMALDFGALLSDTLAVSAHKLGGPKGVGALLIRDGIDLAPLVRGGGQERRRRAGTENVMAIAGFGAAAASAIDGLATYNDRMGSMRDRLEAGVRAVTPEAVIVGQSVGRIANTSSIALPGRLAEALVIKLDLAGIAVSAGSACSSGKVGANHVLAAMGWPANIAQSAIRVSLGVETVEADIAAFLAAWTTIASQPALAA